MPAEFHRTESNRRKPKYEPRRAAETLLYSIVSDRLESFLARTEERGGRVPRFVEREFRSFLTCGIPAHGFLRVRCDDCKLDRVVPFSCKGRGFCPSCGGRRMADTAAHLVDRVLPKAPVRQWVLSLPFPLRYRLAYDADLAGEILRLFVRAIFASYRRRARKKGANGRLHGGAVTFVQRFGDALNSNLHFHTLALDGLFDAAADMRFRVLPPPDDAEVERVALRIARGLRRLLEQRGLGPHDDPELADPLAAEDPALAALYAASVRGKIAEGQQRGQQVLRFGDRVSVDAMPGMAKVTPRCAKVAGLSLHANVAIPAGDRAKLAALVPPPRCHTVRYHGILASAARRRAAVVPIGAPGKRRDPQHGHADCRSRHAEPDTATCAPANSPQRERPAAVIVGSVRSRPHSAARAPSR